MNIIFTIANLLFFRFGYFHFGVRFGVNQFREFRIVLHEDPSSIFVPNVQIENTMGPVHYDISRIYSGILEGKH